MKKVIAFAGGGTGGHIFPIKNLIENINDEEYQILRFGSKNSLEEKIATELQKQRKNLIFLPIMTGKLRRYITFQSIFQNIVDVFKNIIGFFQSLFYIVKYQPNFVFSKGGFVAFVPCLAGKLCFKKVYVHESDTAAGLTNRMIFSFANKIFLGFENMKTKINKSNKIVVGQLISNLFFQNFIYSNNKKTNILVSGGSQGSKIIIETIKNLIENGRLDDFDITILGGTKNENEKFETKNVTFYPFLDQKELVKIYEKTDISITRGSATSLAEQDQFDIKKIIVPLPYTGGNHQYFNALEYQKKGDILLSQLDKNFKENLENEILKLRNYRRTLGSYRTEIDGKKVVLKEIL